MNSPRSAHLLGTAWLLGALVVAGSAYAHNWGCWTQPNRTVYIRNTAVLASQASAAIQDWDSKTILTLPLVNYHTEVSVYDGFYGNTGWAGIASIESYSGCNILHGHARVNRSYSYTSNGYRGIFCQEVGHLFGLDHSNDGGCMGGGYYYSINTYYTVVSHNVSDISAKYSGLPAATAPEDALASWSPSEGLDALSGGASRAVAFWHERPQTLREAADRSEAIVVARVLRVVAGPDLVVPVEGLEDGVDRIPTQRILVSVERTLRGQLKSRLVELFRTGDSEFVLAEDPPYAVGERYVLFLTTMERGLYRPIAPEGRLKITPSGLVPSSEREFMSELRGGSVEMLSGDLAQLNAPLDEASAERAGLQLRTHAGNPFSSRTSVAYALPRAADVTLKVYDPQGRLVRTLVDARQDGPRWYTVEWDGTDDQARAVPNGIYFYRLQTPDGMKSAPVVRIR